MNIGDQVFVSELNRCHCICCGINIEKDYGILTISRISPFGSDAYFDFVEREGWAWDNKCRARNSIEEALASAEATKQVLEAGLENPDISDKRKKKISEDIDWESRKIDEAKQILTKFKPKVVKKPVKHKERETSGRILFED